MSNLERGLAAITIIVCVVGIALTLGCGAEQSQSDNGSATVPGAEGIDVTPVTTRDGVYCIVASNDGSGSIALSCDWGG